MTEITQLIDDKRVGGFHFRVMAFCGLVMLFDGYDITVMGLAVPSVGAALHLPPAAFTLALTASLVGLGLGAGFGGPLGDRLGRKRVMAWSLTIAALATLATAFSGTTTDFFIWRLLTGLGIGGMVPNATTLTAEYMPLRKRSWLVTIMYCSVGVGGFLAGIIATPVMAAAVKLGIADWRGLFIFGGVGSLIAAAAVAVFTPESIKFLMAKRPGDPRIPRIAAGLFPGLDPASLTIAPEIARRYSVLDLLSREYRARTALIWVIYVFNIFIIYLLTSWLPTILRAAHWTSPQALTATGMFQLGGVVGAFALSGQIDRGRPNLGLTIGYSLGAVALLGLVITPTSFVNWAGLILLVGVGIAGAQNMVVAISAALYPLTIRATGVGWAVTIGRIGAISAPPVGAMIIQHFTPVQALGLMIIPALIAAGASVLIRKAWLER